jgi:hypothetical protein
MAKKKASSETGIVSWQDMMATEAKEVAKTERPSVGRISLQSGVMTYEGTPVPDNEMICIVADVIEEQVYYDQPFEPGVVNPPACFAYGEPGSTMAAHEAVPDRDWEKWGACAGCIMNQWRKPPKKGKPCGNRRKLAILPGLDNVEDYKTAEIAVLSLPVMSVKNWGTYVNILSAQHQRPCWGVRTKVSVRPDPKSQFRVHFEFEALLEDDFIAAVHAKRDICRNTLMVPYDLTPKEETADSGKY